jgi:glycosyltransferase involved in cell wall biosynthesis
MTVCIQYAKPSSGQLEGEVYGLDVAVDNFLSAWFRHGTADKFICLPVDIASLDHFKALAAAQGVDAGTRCIGLDPRTPKYNLTGMGCVFRPDPLVTGPLWRRQQVPGRGYAACGLVHTMSGERIAQAVGDLCLAPAGPGDALICPSPAIRDAVRKLWEIQSEYLNHHFSGAYKCPIETPVIPLGIETQKFANFTAPGKRAAQRAALGLADDEILILFVGRLSFATKAHPLALWQAAERAAQHSKRKVRIVMYGYFKPKEMEQHFRGLAADYVKTARLDFVMNGDARFPDGLWAAADMFASLSDNIQESFGLTPIEAMAAGLPVIVSDWNGYRGGVRDGQEGFLIPTFAPPPAAGFEIAERYYNEQNYGMELIAASQSTIVDVGRCAEAMTELIEDAGKRRAMGEKGRARARDIYDWRHIIKAYEELWRELAHKRQTANLKPALPPDWQAVHPAYPNPWAMFASFPSGFLSPADPLRVILPRADIETLLKHEMNLFAPELLLPKELLLNIVDVIRKAGAPSIGDIVNSFPDQEKSRIWRSIGWMLKFGVCARG